MPIVPFAEWVPDAADYRNPGSVSVKNVLPSRSGYEPMKSMVTVTNALGTRPRAALGVRDADGIIRQYAGDSSKLYELVNTTWTDRSKSGGYATPDEETWSFARFKNKMLATNFADNPQQITLGDPTFGDLTSDFRCKFLAVVRDFVVAGATYDSTDGTQLDRVRWSAFNDETDWTVSTSTGADYRNLKTGGRIQGVLGGEYGVIILESSVFRMSFSGKPAWFQMDETIPGIGAIAPGTIARLGDTIYFWSEQGFVGMIAGTNHQFIGANKVDKTVRNDLDTNYKHRISSVVDPKSGRVFWAYPGSGNTGGRPNKIVCYDRTLNRWSQIEVDVELLWAGFGAAETLESLALTYPTLDSVPVSLDSERWKGTAAQLSAFDSNFKHATFSGDPMTATIETKEVQLTEGRRSMLSSFRALVDGGTTTIQVGARDRQSDTIVFDSAVTERASGAYATRNTARFHRFKASITGSWTDAIGIEVTREDARRADRRG